MSEYLRFTVCMLRAGLTGSRAYYTWLGTLLAGVLAGIFAYALQLRRGLAVTNMSDQVSWGAYIANFTFLVGIAAAAVLLVVPAYVYKRSEIKRVVLLGELLATSAIVMCLLFVTVDLGRPDRLLHMLPGIGRLNFPRSILAWDVVVLSVYLLLNLHIPSYLLFAHFRGKPPAASYYRPFVFLSIGWALSIHTVTAFLYSGLGGRPFWNTAILAPRFIVSAFASGPALLIVVFWSIDRFTSHPVRQEVFSFLKATLRFTLPLNYFLLACELFTEFYTNSAHTISARYLFWGIEGHALLKPYIWSSLILGGCSLAIFLWPRLYRSQPLTLLGSVLCVVAIWIEKGMGLIVPGFIPSPAGDLVEYAPSWIEALVCLGIWCTGALIFSAMAKSAIALTAADQAKA